MFFKKSKKAEPVENIENISTHKELQCAFTFANRDLNPLVMSIKDSTLFDSARELLSNNISKNYIYKCGNGAVNLKHFCMVTFTEKDVAD